MYPRSFLRGALTMDRPVIKRIKFVTLQDCQWLIICLSKMSVYLQDRSFGICSVQTKQNRLFTLCAVLCIILSHLFSTFEIKIIKIFIF